MESRHRGPPLERSAPTRDKPSRAERDARTAFLEGVSTMTPFVAVEVGEELFFVASDDLGPGREIFVKRDSRDRGVLERAVSRLAEFGLELPADALFVDVGANIGTTTVFALRRQGFAAGVALEPSPENYRLLRLNLVANGIDRRVRALHVAVTDRPGEVAFDARDPKRGRHHIAELEARSAGQLVVDAVTIDGLVADGIIEPERVGLLWLDAARHEAEILTAATSLIEAGVPVVTALRPDAANPERSRSEPWASLLPRLDASYTHVVDLRRSDPRKRGPINDFGRYVDSVSQTHDLLLVRR